MQLLLNQSIIGCGTENGVQTVSQPRCPLTRCPSEVAAACAARLCCVLPPQSLHHRVFSAMAAANTKELVTQHENGGIRPTTLSTFSQVHTCRGIWAASAHVVALPQLHGVRTCTAAVLHPVWSCTESVCHCCLAQFARRRGRLPPCGRAASSTTPFSRFSFHTRCALYGCESRCLGLDARIWPQRPTTVRASKRPAARAAWRWSSGLCTTHFPA